MLMEGGGILFSAPVMELLEWNSSFGLLSGLVFLPFVFDADSIIAIEPTEKSLTKEGGSILSMFRVRVSFPAVGCGLTREWRGEVDTETEVDVGLEPTALLCKGLLPAFELHWREGEPLLLCDG